MVFYERLDTLCFLVMETGTPGSHFGQDSSRNLLQPIFPWQTRGLD